jgi:uncharacterized protein (TIGR02001 family)
VARVLLRKKSNLAFYLSASSKKEIAMKKLILATAVMAAFAASVSHAEEKKPDNELSFNAAVVSDYRYRGISQTRLDPALQGGADFVNNPTGLYVGTWLSSIKWIKDTPGAGSTPAEWDIYAGKKGEITKDVSYDVGGLGYVYLNNKLDDAGLANANTFELYGQVGYGPAYLKYSHSVTNLFGIPDSKNSGYVDIGASFELGGGYTLGLHAGHQSIKNHSGISYNDYKIGVNKEFYGVNFGLAAIGTDADKSFYVTPSGKFTGKTSLVLSAAKTF